MATRAMVEEFLAVRNLALVRASRTARVAGFSISDELAKKGYTISVVYLDEEGSLAELKSLPEPVGGIIIAVPSAQCEKAVRLAIDAGVKKAWLQQGSESKAGIDLCESNGISVVHGECVMMFAEPVKSFHAVHRFIWKLLGLLPK